MEDILGLHHFKALSGLKDLTLIVDGGISFRLALA